MIRAALRRESTSKADGKTADVCDLGSRVDARLEELDVGYGAVRISRLVGPVVDPEIYVSG